MPRLLQQHPAIRHVELAGSRARGDANVLSDWDFVVETDDPQTLRRYVSNVLKQLDPLVEQWDRLSEHWCYMLILRGGVKVDIILEEMTQDQEPPWQLTRETLAAIDAHFWDWIVWLGSKTMKGDDELIARELKKLFDHLLEPMGADEIPRSLAAAVDAYVNARDVAERRFEVEVGRELENEVTAALRRANIEVQ